MAAIPKVLHEHINTAFPENVCLVGTVQPDGFAQISPHGSTAVYDDQHFSLWERGRGSTPARPAPGRPRGRPAGDDLLPQAAIAGGRRAAEWRHRALLRRCADPQIGRGL